MKKQGPHPFETTYPAITRWVKEFGRVEIGTAGFTGTFVKAIDRDGMRWGGKGEYGTIDEALQDLEKGIEAFLVGQGQDKDRRPSTTGEDDGQERRKSPSRADKDQPRSAKRRRSSRRSRSSTRIAEAASPGRALPGHPADDAQGPLRGPRGRRGVRPVPGPQDPAGGCGRKRPRSATGELVNRAVRELKPYLDDPPRSGGNGSGPCSGRSRRNRTSTRPIPWGVVRNVKSFDLLVVEHALKAVLRGPTRRRSGSTMPPGITPGGRETELIPKSAPMVEDIAGFWRKHLGIKR